MNQTLVALESIHREAGYIAKNTFENGRECPTELEIEHLIKMTNDVVMRIKSKTLEVGN